MTKNATNSILMIRPVRFGMNAQTAVDNFYQQAGAAGEANEDNRKAQLEFDAFVAKLRLAGVNVVEVQDSYNPHTPDSIFPNNWISMHEDGTVVLYPMKAENRRLERRSDIEQILTNEGFAFQEVYDLSVAEDDQRYLEGTGSIIFDHDRKLLTWREVKEPMLSCLISCAVNLVMTPLSLVRFKIRQSEDALYITPTYSCA